MILALNIGNSNITFGSYTPDGKLVFSSRLFADTLYKWYLIAI